MKSGGTLEPGVLPTFRLFIGAQFVISILGLVVHLFQPFPSSLEIVRHLNSAAASAGIVQELAFIALASGPLFLYLSAARLRQTLGRFYLPIAILWAGAAPVLSPYLHGAGSNAQDLFLQSALWQQTILLFVPLIVISWQYSIRVVFAFCALTVALNIALLLSGILPIAPALVRSLLGVIFVELVAFLLVGHMISNLVRVQREQRKGLAEANERLAQYASTLEQLTISRERNRLGRELHDVLAHTLSGVAVELEGLRTILRRDPDQASALLDHSLQAIREGLTETRRALQELRAKPLEDLGLALAVRSLAESYASRAGFQIELSLDNDLDDTPDEVQQCIYRIAQEAMANIAEHAQAKSAQVALKHETGQLKLIVQDDGCGFDPDDPDTEQRYGLLGMRERAEMIGGTLSVESQAGKGTRVMFSYMEHR